MSNRCSKKRSPLRLRQICLIDAPVQTYIGVERESPWTDGHRHTELIRRRRNLAEHLFRQDFHNQVCNIVNSRIARKAVKLDSPMKLLQQMQLWSQYITKSKALTPAGTE